MKKNKVLFCKCLSIDFDYTDKDPNTIYFLTDTHEIYLGPDKYSSGSASSSNTSNNSQDANSESSD